MPYFCPAPATNVPAALVCARARSVRGLVCAYVGSVVRVCVSTWVHVNVGVWVYLCNDSLTNIMTHTYVYISRFNLCVIMALKVHFLTCRSALLPPHSVQGLEISKCLPVTCTDIRIFPVYAVKEIEKAITLSLRAAQG